MRNLLSVSALALLALTAVNVPAKADFFSSLGLPSNTYGDPTNPSGTFASWSPAVQSDCAQPGTTNGAVACDGRNHSLDAGRAAQRASDAAKAGGASDAEAAAAGEAARTGAGG